MNCRQPNWLSFLTVLCLVLFSSPAVADPNKCVASAPNGSSLTVHTQPDSQSGALGGIGVGQCNITVTNQCDGTWCVIVHHGLNGWVDMQHISGSPVQAPGLAGSQATTGGDQSFEILGGSGTVSMMGQTQPTPVDPGGIITLQSTGDGTALLILPSPVFSSPPTMRRGPGGVWTGSFGEWAGIPATVDITMRGLTGSNPLLEMAGTSPMAEFAMEMQLRRVGGAPGQAGSSPAIAPSTPGAGGPGACAELQALSARINAQADTNIVQEMRGIYVQADLAFGAAQTPEKCQRALDLIAASPAIQALLASGEAGQATMQPAQPTQGPGAVRNDSNACNAVDEIASAIEEVNERRLNLLFGFLVDEAGIMDLFAATEAQCNDLLISLDAEGLTDAQAVREQARINASLAGQTPAVPVQPAQLSDACREVLVIDRAVEAVNNRSVAMVFDSSMASIPMTDVFSATEGQCLALLELLTMEGLGSPEQAPILAQRLAETNAAATQPVVPTPVPAPASVSPPSAQRPACDALATALRPILRGGTPSVRQAALGVMQAAGVVDVGNSSNQACARVMIDLIAGAIIPNDGVDWAAMAQGPAPSTVTPQVNAPTTTQTPGACLALGDRLVAVVNRGMNRELIAMSDILLNTGIRSLSGETNTACTSAIDAANAAGIGQ